ncbi:conserved hypothetical protein [Bradyrhizobium sp. ORS 375]|uniref:hypothetical protein n=1 Tax=Bradyrhizobium sp. (strain ORS 375) TaxID=566679 RepID=UPI0002406F1C|nr:hypothetical protein [Bradyrhizobium sp. ORS 375]CCD94705.1 conserved hypothetical protein [Bradyrhizobium sp. ORS 375]
MNDLPPKVARAFVAAMEAYFAEPDPAKRGQIAVLQMHALREHWTGKLRLHDVEAMFREMREHLGKDRPSSQPPKRQRLLATSKVATSAASLSKRRS